MFKFKGTIAIVVLVIVLVAYVLLVEIKNPSKEEKEEQNKVVFKIDTDNIKSIAIKRDGKEMLFEKHQDGWYFSSPVKAKVDEGTFNGLLANIAEFKADKKIEEISENLSSYGLEKPVCSVSINLNDGKVYAISIGNKTFDDNSYYAKIGEEKKIFILPSYVVDGYFLKSLTDLRDKNVISVSQDGVTEFEFRHNKEKIKALKDEKNRWNIKSPFEGIGDSGIITAWLSSLQTLVAANFIDNVKDEELSFYGLDKPFIDISVTEGKDKKKKSLLIGKKDGLSSYYAKRPGEGTIFILEPSGVDNLYREKISNWKDKSIFPPPFGEIVSFEIKKGNTLLSGNKDNSKWTLVKPLQKEGSSWRIESQLGNILNLKNENSITEGPRTLDYYGLHKPDIIVTISSKDKEKASLFIGKGNKDNSAYYAKREEGKEIFTINKIIVDGLNDLITNPPYKDKEKN